ncbi:MAG: HAMP domain-containing histidine kinase [candidate division Zixibacteria bacterium]|nr:HAMP domain-containing histidine kinase [candidate division Zixibacteria bacterium]
MRCEEFESKYLIKDFQLLYEDQVFAFYEEGGQYPSVLSLNTYSRKSVYLRQFIGNTLEIKEDIPTKSAFTSICPIYNEKMSCVGYAYSEECSGGYYIAFNDFKKGVSFTTPVIKSENSYTAAGDELFNAGISHCWNLEINNDNIKDYLVVTIAGYDQAPRGVRAYNGRDASELWIYPTAGIVNIAKIVDTDHDGTNEIILGTHAVANGRIVNGYSDSTANLHCIGLDGKRIWSDTVAYYYKCAIWDIGSLNDDNSSFVVNFFQDQSPGSIDFSEGLQLRDPVNGKVLKYRLFKQGINTVKIKDVNRDLKDDIIISSEEGYVRILKRDLADSLEFNLAANPTIDCIEDIEDDGDFEIIGNSAEGIWILNNNLDPILKNGPAYSVSNLLKHPKAGILLHVARTENEHIKNKLMIMQDVPITDKAFGYFSKIRFEFLILVLLIGILIGIQYQRRWSPTILRDKKKRKSEVKSQILYKEFLESLNSFGHGKLPTRNLDLMTMYFSNPIAEGDRYVAYRKRLLETLETYQNHTEPVLKSLANKALILGTDDDQSGIMELYNKVDEFVKNVIESDVNIELISTGGSKTAQDIEKIRERIRQSRKTVQSHFSCDPISIINNVLKAASKELNANGITIESFKISGCSDRFTHISSDELAMIIEELISNASTAMEKSIEKKISIVLRGSKEITYIDVSDAGKGIPYDNYGKIFSREYTSKTSGGYGLYYISQTIEKYGGKIYVLKSEKDHGTTFRMEFVSVN